VTTFNQPQVHQPISSAQRIQSTPEMDIALDQVRPRAVNLIEFFASVFTEEQSGALPEAEKIFKGREDDEI